VAAVTTAASEAPLELRFAMPLSALYCLVSLCLIPAEPGLPYADVSISILSSADRSADPPQALAAPDVRPVLPRPAVPKSTGVEWTAVSRSALRFLGVMDAFRWATEQDTRNGGFGLGDGYIRAVTNLHGWADGDPYYVNYFGHPAQGAISSRLFLNHDPRYRKFEFGGHPGYWKGKLRAAAFSFAFSEQFELGLVSEASIGRIQNRFPQQGFVDHVIIPTVGFGLSVAEDAVDRYIIQTLEGRIRNRWARLALRTALSPTRSFANVMDRKAPWHRETRAGVLKYEPSGDPLPGLVDQTPKPVIAPFEFRIASGYRTFESGPCIGAGAEAAYRIAPQWQILLDANGCNLLGLMPNLSGDALFYQVGSRWTPLPAAKWSPYVQLLVGGMKLSHEQFFSEKKHEIELANPNPTHDPDLAHQLHGLYTSSEERNGLAVSAGTGVDYRFSDALAIRVAGLEYSRSTLGTLGGLGYSRGFRISTGLVLRLGTW